MTVCERSFECTVPSLESEKHLIFQALAYANDAANLKVKVADKVTLTYVKENHFCGTKQTCESKGLCGGIRLMCPEMCSAQDESWIEAAELALVKGKCRSIESHATLLQVLIFL